MGGCEHYNGNVWMTAELFKDWVINLQDLEQNLKRLQKTEGNPDNPESGALYSNLQRASCCVFKAFKAICQTLPHLFLLKHDYMFRSVQTIIKLPLQNFQNKAKYTAIIIHTTGSCMCYNSYYNMKFYKTI